MKSPQQSSQVSWPELLVKSAGIGVSVTLLYAAAFALYAMLRSSAEIFAALVGEALLMGTLAASAASIIIASLSSGLLLALPSALVAVVTASAIKLLFLVKFRWNRGVAAAIALMTTITIAALIHAALWLTMGPPVARLGVQTYLFWVGLPTLCFITITVMGALWLINRIHISSVRNGARSYV